MGQLSPPAYCVGGTTASLICVSKRLSEKAAWISRCMTFSFNSAAFRFDLPLEFFCGGQGETVLGCEDLLFVIQDRVFDDRLVLLRTKYDPDRGIVVLISIQCVEHPDALSICPTSPWVSLPIFKSINTWHFRML